MRLIVSGLMFMMIASPLTEAINPAIYTPHTEYRKIQHSQSTKVIKIRSDERFVRKIPRYIKRAKHSLNRRQGSYPVVDVAFVEGQRVGTPGVRKLNEEATNTGAETPVFGNDYGNRRDQRILTSRERRQIILGDRRNPSFKRIFKNQGTENTEENPQDGVLWYGTTFKQRTPAKPAKEDPNPIVIKPVIPQGSVAPGKFPNTADMTLSVINKTQGHVDATTVDAMEGDIFKFTIDFLSKEEGVHDFSAMIDVSDIMNRVYLTDIDRGYYQNGNVVFDKFTLSAPIKRTYTFEAQFHRCRAESKYLTVVAHESTVNIPTVCE